MCSEEGKQRGLCVREFEGINRGGYTEGAERFMCSEEGKQRGHKN